MDRNSLHNNIKFKTIENNLADDQHHADQML